MPKLLLIFVLGFFSCKPQVEENNPLTLISQEHSGIDFINKVEDTEEFNIHKYLYFYNGGGVAIGDVNNDGLSDIYFGSNLSQDALYINEGNLKFRRATDMFVEKDLLGWSTGVNMVDVNQDGWLDIYVCRLGNYLAYNDHNKLFINQNGKNFVEQSATYGLDFSGFSTQSNFFDYDKDGDLDCYILNHSVKNVDQFKKSGIRYIKDSLAGDLLLENKNGTYIDVTKNANIYSSSIGFGLGIDVADMNDDGWPDIYIANDFHENDYLYINQKNKTFKEVITSATDRNSNFSMGCTVEDIDNNGLMDILTLDMKPFSDDIYKASGGWENISVYNYKRSFGYHHQSPKNAIQFCEDVIDGIPVYKELAAFYGLDDTDWSWSPLIADFDNDGDKDIYITNGIVRRPNDMDYIDFHFNELPDSNLLQIKKIPAGAVPNVYFENDGNNKFRRIYSKEKTCSTGAAIGDLDNDGYLEIVINNVNSVAQILKPNHVVKNNFLNVRTSNNSSIGTKIVAYADSTIQSRMIKNTSGFQSHSETTCHFGFGKTTPDSLKVIWSDDSCETLVIDSFNRTLVLERKSDQKYQYDIKRNDNNTVHSLKLISPAKDNDQLKIPWLLYNLDNSGPQIHISDSSSLSVIGYGDGFDLSIYGDSIVSKKNKSFSSEHIDRKVKEYFERSGDFDKDGDLDCFIGVHSVKDQYHVDIPSFILARKEDNGIDKLDLDISGMVMDAEWFDIDGNGWDDLIIVGHWMPVTVFLNKDGRLSKTTIESSEGLWNCLKIVDLDGDNKYDIVVGNYGENHGISVSNTKPLKYYHGDFDLNGVSESLISYVDIDSNRERPYPNRSLFVEQLPIAKKKFNNHRSYIEADIDDIISISKDTELVEKKVVTLKSAIFEYDDGEFIRKELPEYCQTFPIMALEYIKNEYLILGGNIWDIDPNWGRQDAGRLMAIKWNNPKWEIKTEYLNIPYIRDEIRDIMYSHNKLYWITKDYDLKYVELN